MKALLILITLLGAQVCFADQYDDQLQMLQQMQNQQQQMMNMQLVNAMNNRPQPYQMQMPQEPRFQQTNCYRDASGDVNCSSY